MNAAEAATLLRLLFKLERAHAEDMADARREVLASVRARLQQAAQRVRAMRTERDAASATMQAVEAARERAGIPSGYVGETAVTWLASEVVQLRRELEDQESASKHHKHALVDLLAGFAAFSLNGRLNTVVLRLGDETPRHVQVEQRTIETLVRLLADVERAQRARREAAVSAGEAVVS